MLTVSSYATRTSPVLRGKWVLDNLLNSPPPPPPPDVPNLDEATIGTAASMREQLEAHRKDPICASCHRRMDPLGFGLENFDAVGAWRTMDGKFPIDASGALPGRPLVHGPGGARGHPRGGREAFAQCLTSKLLTYALGRGLERYDTRTVKLIASRLPAHDYRFSGTGAGNRQQPALPVTKGRAHRSRHAMIVTRRHLPRRTFLKGMGAVIALPMLDAMTPAFARAAHVARPPVRLAFTYVPNGITMNRLDPGGDRRGLRVHAGDEAARAVPQGHAGAVRPRAPERRRARRRPRRPRPRRRVVPDRRAPAQDRRRRHPERHLGRPGRRAARRHRTRGSRRSSSAATTRARSATATPATRCAYTNSLAWRGPATPMPPETNPRLVFERLFGDIDTSIPPETRARRLRYRRSILDLVGERTTQLGADLGTSDRRKLDEYLTSIREIERRIEKAEQDITGLTPDIDKPTGVPVEYADYVKLMFDLQLIAFQTDSTRVVDDDDGPRGQHADLSGDRRARPAPPADPPPRQPGVDREGHEDQHDAHGAVRAASSAS